MLVGWKKESGQNVYVHEDHRIQEVNKSSEENSANQGNQKKRKSNSDNNNAPADDPLTKTLEKEKKKLDNDQLKDGKIKEYGQTTLVNEERKSKIHLISIIGEVEGHECLSQNTKATKYEHILPQLAAIEDSNDIDGLLVLLNTVGGDVEAGLAIAEMISSLSKPTVSLVLGGSHSIGGPLAVSTDYSYIVPTATMIIHPVRMNGSVIGVAQTFEYIDKIQERIISFVVSHSHISREEFKALMLDTTQLVKDVGSILIGEEAVKSGMIDEVGGIKEALAKLYEMINQKNDKKTKHTEEAKKHGNGTSKEENATPGDKTIQGDKTVNDAKTTQEDKITQEAKSARTSQVNKVTNGRNMKQNDTKHKLR